MFLGCPFSQEVWYHILLPLRLHRFTPSGFQTLQDWWRTITSSVAAAHRRDLNTTIAATLRFIWLERNNRVFEQRTSSVTSVVSTIHVEIELWKSARVERGRIFEVH